MGEGGIGNYGSPGPGVTELSQCGGVVMIGVSAPELLNLSETMETTASRCEGVW